MIHNNDIGDPSPPDLIRLFTDERRMIFLHVQKLRHAVDSINEHGFSALAFDEIAGAIRFIGFEIRMHIENEETILFPSIEQYFTTLLFVLKNEHKELLNTSGKLIASVNDIENGFIRNTSIKELVSYTETTISLLENHLQKEETSLLPFIKKSLSDEEYNQLAQTLLHAHTNGNTLRTINSGKTAPSIAA
ncbi:MAG TPA: hemerythrin domain-containing protein [Candidatus Kapabacteria bacterium]|nr:hemerythrin domain-containing protein [Candidatus Kapabacteria bacterium]